MCADGRPDDNGFGVRILTGSHSDAYLQRRDVGQVGYTVVIWRGRHVADPTELSDADAAAYFAEVLRVGRAIERHYRPAKMNFEMLGNSLPHLHTHVVPRYADDSSPGFPPEFMRRDLPVRDLDPERFARDVQELKRLLT